MNKLEDHLCEITTGPEHKHSNTVESSEKLIKCRATCFYIPVYNTHSNVYRGEGEILDENIENTTAKPGQLKCLDFGMNVNMKLSENRSFFNWLCHTKLKRLTGALFTVILIIFLPFLFYSPKQITTMTIDMDSFYFVVLLYVASSVSGKIMSMVSKIPPFVGMILTGMALKNCGIFIYKDIDPSIFWFYISELMESVILIISGLELNIFELRKTSGVVLRLAFLPQIAESFAMVLIVHFFWPDFINSCFEIFVVVNLSGINSVLFNMSSLEKLKHLGCFDTNNIYTLLNAASTVIDLAAVIFNYSVVDVLVNTNRIETYQTSIAHLAKEMSVDIVFGIFWGLLIVFVASPNRSKQYNLQECADNNSQEFNRQITSLLTILKSVALFPIGVIFFLLYKENNRNAWSYSLSCGISSLVAGTCWRWRITKYDNSNALTLSYNDAYEYDYDVYAIIKVFKYFWKYLQPLFYAYIGAGFQAEYFSFWMLFIAPLVIVFELIIRIIITTFSVRGSGFNRNELLFINIAWLPNSTLMACLATTYLMSPEAIKHKDFDLICKIFNFTIISYLMTSILGSFTVLNYGPLLLSTTVNVNNNDQADNE